MSAKELHTFEKEQTSGEEGTSRSAGRATECEISSAGEGATHDQARYFRALAEMLQERHSPDGGKANIWREFLRRQVIRPLGPESQKICPEYSDLDSWSSRMRA